MTPEETRKLLGGYATNALTAEEHKRLFEAALEDQELFDALQKEDALRELLADPVSRDEARKALENPIPDQRRGSFWSRRWMFGLAIPAVAAVIVIAVMTRLNAPAPQPRPAMAPQIASNRIASGQIASDKLGSSQIASNQEALPPETKPEANKRGEAKALDKTARATAPVIPAPVQLEADSNALAPRAKALALPTQAGQQQSQGMSSQQVVALKSGAAPQIPEAIRQQFSSGFTANAPLYQGPLVRYSLLRSGPTEDAVRVEVSTGVAGYMALYRVDASGTSKQVYPAKDLAELVLPDLTIQIPSDPIKISGAREKLRLVVIPVAPPASIGQIGGSIANAIEKTPEPPAPLVVDIPLGQN
jgi:hypothetical protein